MYNVNDIKEIILEINWWLLLYKILVVDCGFWKWNISDFILLDLRLINIKSDKDNINFFYCEKLMIWWYILKFIVLRWLWR